VESHDSLLTRVREADADDVALLMKQEMSRPIDFSGCSLARGILVIPADIEFGYNYKELNKYKFKEQVVV
jgi:hypothetical protein